MPVEAPTAPAPVAPPSAPVAAPSPASSPAPAAPRTGPAVDPALTAQAEQVLGHYALPATEEPTATPDTTAPAPDATASPTGEHAAAGTPAPTPAPGKDGQTTGKLPGEDYLAELDKIAGTLESGQPTPTPATPETAKTFEDFEKSLGDKAASMPLEEYRKQAQSFFGKQANELGTLRKNVTTLTEGYREIAKRFTVDKETGAVVPTVQGFVEFGDMLPPEQIQEALASRNLKLVPIDAQVQMGEDPAEKAWVDEFTVNIKSGEDWKNLTADEKLAEIESDPKLRRKMDSELSAWKAGNRVQLEAREAQRQQREAAAVENDRRLTQDFMQKLKAHAEYSTTYQSALKTWNALLGPDVDASGRRLPGALTGDKRLKVLRALIEVPRLKAVMGKAVRDAYQAGIDFATGVTRGVGAIPGGGGTATFVDHGAVERQQAGELVPEGEADAMAKTLGARRGPVS